MHNHKATCQICGKSVFTRNGLLLAHSYTREFDGKKINRCPGSDNLPIKKSCTAITDQMDHTVSYIARIEAEIFDFYNYPPDLLFYFTKDAIDTVNKPATFDPKKASKSGNTSLYEKVYFDTLTRLNRASDTATEYLKQLEERLEQWQKATTPRVSITQTITNFFTSV